MEFKILEYMISYIHEHGYAPSAREIGKEVGLSSSSSVSYYLKRMYQKGLIVTESRGGGRAYRVKGMKVVFEGNHE